MSADEAVFRRERAYITKLNAILVAVLKQEWPHRWPTFITDLVAAAKTSETLCENCMVILKARMRRGALPTLPLSLLHHC
jgi:exportin-1